jgi:flap endonuclease GEN
MVVGGKLWDLLEPYARHDGPDFLREKGSQSIFHNG